MLDLTLFWNVLRGRCLMLSSRLFQTFTATKRMLNLLWINCFMQITINKILPCTCTVLECHSRLVLPDWENSFHVLQMVVSNKLLLKRSETRNSKHWKLELLWSSEIYDLRAKRSDPLKVAITFHGCQEIHKVTNIWPQRAFS